MSQHTGSIYNSPRDTVVAQEKLDRGFPGGSVVKNLPANAGEPWSGKIPHAAEQLSPCATTTEPVL